MGNSHSSGHSRNIHMVNIELRTSDVKNPDAIVRDGDNSDEVIPSKNENITCVKKQTNRASDNFIIHGIDYLPESAKRKERQKKNVPKFLLFEEPIWHNSYLNFWNRFLNGHINSNGNNHNGKTPAKPAKATSTSEKLLEPSGMTRSVTAYAGFSDEKLSAWKTYSDYPFQSIVMSGGGSKGYAYIGSLKALEDCGILKRVTKVAGSSAGAICAGLLAVGCSPQEIADVFKCDIKWLFHDQTCACCCYLPRVCNKFGIHPAKRFHEIYGEHLKKKVGNSDITFLQLKETRNIELCIVVTNLSRMCSEYLTYNTSPNLPIRDAVRMSMAFPVVFRAVRYNLTGRECVYTDGGLLDQYPIHCFDGRTHTTDSDHEIDDEKEDEQSNGCPNMATLGLYVVSEKPIDHKIWRSLFGHEIPCKPTYLPNTKLARERLEKEMAIRKMHNKKFDKQEFMDELCSSVGDGAKQVLDHYEIWNKSHVDIRNFGEYFITTIETLLISQRKLRIKAKDSLRTVPINCGYIGTNDYVIEPGDREFMIDQGYTCTVRYLREFISLKQASRSSAVALSSLRKKKVPRSRSSNLAEQHNIQDWVRESNERKIQNNTENDFSCPANARNDSPRYFLSGEEKNEGERDYSGFTIEETSKRSITNDNLTSKECKTDDNHALDLKSWCNQIGTKPFTIVTSENYGVSEFFRTNFSNKQTTPCKELQRVNDATITPKNGDVYIVGNDQNHSMNSCDATKDCCTRHDSCYSNGAENFFEFLPEILDMSSVSIESEYEDMVNRTLLALGGNTCNFIPESSV